MNTSVNLNAFNWPKICGMNLPRRRIQVLSLKCCKNLVAEQLGVMLIQGKAKAWLKSLSRLVFIPYALARRLIQRHTQLTPIA